MPRRPQEEQEPDRVGPARVPARAGAQPGAVHGAPGAARAAHARTRRAAVVSVLY